MIRMVSSVVLFFCLGCAAPRQAVAPSTPLKEFRVPLPGPEWKSVSNAKVDDGPPAMLALMNEKRNVLIRFDAARIDLTPSMLALRASDGFAAGGLRVSTIDFSDPTGERASFTFGAVRRGVEIAGKAAVFRLTGDADTMFVAVGLWPAPADAEMSAVFDAMVASARIR